MAWVEIMPDYETLFRAWESAVPFLDWQGILVNCHRKRRVEEVALDGTKNFFLKKAFSIAWHERFLNAWHGFGWCATAVREGAILIAAKRAGIGCPDVAAFGEHERSAFLLLRGEVGMTELRVLLPAIECNGARRLADALGRELARLHDAGFEHPDLFAKHVLVEPRSQRICILDWARVRFRKLVPWRTRLRDLAVLDATLHPTLASDRLRLQMLRAYLHATKASAPPLARAALHVRNNAIQMRRQRHLREVGQLAAAPTEQQFVPVQEGRLLVVRSYFEQLGGQLPDWLTHPGASMPDRLTMQSWPNSTPNWVLPSLAHVLFRLGRFGVPTPRLLAVGADSSHVFAVTECTPTMPFAEAFAKAPLERRRQLLAQAGRIVRQVHEAGYLLPAGDSWPRRLGVDETGNVLVVKVEPLLRTDAAWQELAPPEFSRQRMHLSRSEQLRFLRSYLGADARRATIETFMISSERLRAA